MRANAISNWKLRHPEICYTIYLGIIVASLSFISKRFNWMNTELVEATQDLQSLEGKTLSTLLYENIIKNPCEEEWDTRRPGFLVLILLCGVSYITMKINRPWSTTVYKALHRKIFGKITGIELCAWPWVIGPTFIWAFDEHPLPIPVFAAGLIFGYIMIRTKLPLNVPLHILINLFNYCGMLLNIHFIQHL